jgi:RNA polymerase sigma-B factor
VRWEWCGQTVEKVPPPLTHRSHLLTVQLLSPADHAVVPPAEPRPLPRRAGAVPVHPGPGNSPEPAPEHPADDRTGAVAPPPSAPGSAADGPARVTKPVNVQARRLLERLATLPEGSAEHARVHEDLVRLHLPLCQHLAARYAGHGEPIEDLFQAATVGLLQAIRRFDPAYGSEFSSFAVPTIVGELKKHFRNTVWSVHVPRPRQELRLLVTRGIGDYAHQHNQAPTVRQLAEFLGRSEEDVLAGIEAARAYRSASLDAPVGDENSTTSLGDTLGGDDPALEGVDYHESLTPLIAQLPERSRRILLLRFYGNQTQSQIAAQIGISQMHVSRLLAHALRTLREGLLVAE